MKNDLEGLGGWLILVGIGIVLSPVRIIAELVSIYPDLFSDGTWDVLTTPGSEAYHVLWAPILIGEMIFNTGLIFVWIFIGFLFFSKKKTFPKWYICILLFTPLYIFIDALLVKIALPDEPLFDLETTKDLVRLFFIVLIWVPYMRVSKRVKATFVN